MLCTSYAKLVVFYYQNSNYNRVVSHAMCIPGYLILHLSDQCLQADRINMPLKRHGESSLNVIIATLTVLKTNKTVSVIASKVFQRGILPRC